MKGIDFEYSICVFGDYQEFSLEPQKNADADIYVGTLEFANYNFEKYFSLLSDIEKNRAAKFRFENDRNLYISTHGLLREKLSEKLKISPLEIRFVTNLYGKPYIYNSSFSFNVSHSRDYFAVIISNSTEVGIDIEGDKKHLDYLNIMNNYCSTNEKEYIEKQPIGRQKFAFYKVWTRKEAMLKAIGVGLIDKLKDIDTIGKLNLIDPSVIKSNILKSTCKYFIYSVSLGETYLSFSGSKPLNFSENTIIFY